MGATKAFEARRILQRGWMGFLVFLVFVIPVIAGDRGGIVDNRGALARDEEPVRIPGSSFPDFANFPIAQLAVFRFDTATQTFVPIPFQIDQQVFHTFNSGTPFEFTETIYDVMHEDNGLLDANDELVFLYGDTGPRVNPNTPWPLNAGTIRYEIAVNDPRPGAPTPQKWVYMFTGEGLARSSVNYITWNTQKTGTISTPKFALEYSDQWLLTGLRIFSPCGSGADLIDRLKGRASPNLNLTEDEEGWNTNSVYLGGLVGPVRAIRYVRGATSGVNTIHRDIVYRAFWKRVLNLRVHPILSCKLYLDWLPAGSTARMYTNLVRTGVKVDGVPDPSVGSTFVDWAVFRNPGGGLAVLFDLPASSKYQAKYFYYVDDASYNDQIPSNPGYGDEDDSAYGAFGVQLSGISDCNIDPIPFEFRYYPLCANTGDAAIGDSYEELRDYPLQTPTTPQWVQSGPVLSLQAGRNGSDVVLIWDPIDGVSGYRIYASEFPDLPHTSWNKLGETVNTFFRDSGAANSPVFRYYSVVGYNPGGEGLW